VHTYITGGKTWSSAWPAAVSYQLLAVSKGNGTGRGGSFGGWGGVRRTKFVSEKNVVAV